MTAQVVEESVTVNSPIQDYTHPDDHAPPAYMKRLQGLKPFTAEGIAEKRMSNWKTYKV